MKISKVNLFPQNMDSSFSLNHFQLNPFRKSSANGKNAHYISEDEFEFPKLLPIRA
jgi:hypothetical protein